MNARNFSPIVPDSPEPRAPLNWIPNFGHRDMDEVAAYAQTVRAVPADPDDVFSQDEDYDDALEVRALLSQRPVPTPNGKWVGIAVDACALLQEVIASHGHVPAARLPQFEAVCARLRNQRQGA